MGTTCRVVLTGPDAAAAALACEERVRALAAALTRFEPSSELSVVNADPRSVVPASFAVRALFRAAASAARISGGLVDASLLSEIAAAGYGASRDDFLAAAPLSGAPPRRPAAPRADRWWQAVVVDDEAGTVARPPGVRIDP